MTARPPADPAALYGDEFADVYDDWYRDLGDPGEVVGALGRLAIDRAGQVVELGVGTGRLALPLAEAGWQVAGIDASAAMLEVLRRKLETRPALARNVTLHCGDVADERAWPDGSADVVLASFNLLLNLPDRVAQAEAVALAAAHLRPGGVLVCETQVLDLRSAPPESTVERPDGVVIHTVVDRAQGTVEGRHVGADGTERRWRLRALAPAELDALAVAAGLSPEARWGNWDGSPFVSGESHTAITVHRRQAGGRAAPGTAPQVRARPSSTGASQAPGSKSMVSGIWALL